MKDNIRVIKLALRHRLNVAACVVTSVIVAIFWGANLTAIYPIVDVIFANRSLSSWIEEKADKSLAKAEEFRTSAAKFRTELKSAAEKSEAHQALQTRISQDEFMADFYDERAGRYRWIAGGVGRYMPDTPFKSLVLICTCVLIGSVLKNLMRYLSMVLVARLSHQVDLQMRKDLYAHILRLDMKEFTEQGRGDLMSRCTGDVSAIGHGVQILFGKALLEPLKVIACLTIAAFISWRLLLITMIIAPVAAFTIRRLAKTLKRANRRAMEQMSAIYEKLTETLSGIELIKAYTMEGKEQQAFGQSAAQFYRQQTRISSFHSLASPFTEFAGTSIIIMAALLGGFLVLNNQTHVFGIRISQVPLTHGWLSLFYVMLAGMTNPAHRLSHLINQLQHASAACDRVYEVLDRQPGITDAPTAASFPLWTTPGPTGSGVRAIAFEDVHFHYLPEKPVLKGITLEVAAGETVAIVGHNGCGKSTMLRLVPRFYDPVQGTVKVDGVELRSLRIKELRERIGLVSQETLMLNDTVAHNIAYGSPDATQEQIEAAAHQAHAHSFIIEKLADGYATVVGPSGNRLSGGQRQRIALARAILRNPEILILDEATNQIDVESERLIYRILQEFTRNRTTLLVTHRMSTISLANRIVVMDAGQIIDVGTHNELISRCNLYRRLNHTELQAA